MPAWLISAQSSDRSGSIHIVFKQTQLSQALKEVSAKSGINIVFSPDMVPAHIVDKEFDANLTVILSTLLHDTGLAFRDKDRQIIIYRDESFFTPFTVSGYIEDEDTGERLIAAHVYDLISEAGTTSNEYGFFSLQGRGRQGRLRVSYLGFRNDTLLVDKAEALNTQYVKLEKLVLLGEVVVEDEKSRYHGVIPLSRHHYSDRQLETKSYLGGERDVQRYMESLPGVSIGTDGIGGLHVRGGSGDENLYLFDGVPIYHSTHAIGILSVFNPLIVREVDLYKGDFPAHYAGRLSSVLDVKTKEGNNRQWSVQTHIGIATANALVEGPIIREKVGIIVAARRFLPGFYLRNLSSHQKEKDGLVGSTDYAFTDLNAKCNIALTPRDKIFLSYYHGDDKYNDLTNTLTVESQSTLTESFERSLNWGNSVGVLRWNHQFGLHVFANTTLTLSSFELRSLDYNNFTEELPSQVEIKGFVSREFKSRIKDASGRMDIDHFLNNANRLRYGVTFTRHSVKPKSIVFDDAAQVDDFVVDEGTLDDRYFSDLGIKASEIGVYLEDYSDIGSALKLSCGLHLSAFDVRDKIYWSLQPRLSLQIELLKNLHGHVSANMMTQYMHLLTSSGIGLPTDLWVPATESVKPQKATQISTGISWQVTPRLKAQSDVYYRAMDNLVAYKEGASFLLTQGSVQSGIVDAANWEDKVTQGSGEAYGWESLVSYTGKMWNSEIAYTYAHARRKFEELNFGRPFPFRFDRRHALSVSGALYITDQLTVSGSWNYATGIPITLAESKFLHPSSSSVFPPIQILQFSEHNAYRLPDYHRLDIGAAYYWRNPKATHSLHLDIYNVYNRHNVLYITLIQDEDNFKNRQFTVLPFIPSLSYHLKL